jgi:hypothetical protein
MGERALCARMPKASSPWVRHSNCARARTHKHTARPSTVTTYCHPQLTQAVIITAAHMRIPWCYS